MANNTNEIRANIETASEAVKAEIEKYLRKFLEKVRTDSVADIDRNKKYATGEMRKNIRYEVTREVGKIIGVVGVGGNVPYAIFAHEDTKPHFPPLEPIQKWVILKGLVKQGGKSTTAAKIHRSKNADATMMEVKGIALAIARKIASKGTKGLPFLRTALNLNKDYLMAQMAQVKI